MGAPCRVTLRGLPRLSLVDSVPPLALPLASPLLGSASADADDADADDEEEEEEEEEEADLPTASEKNACAVSAVWPGMLRGAPINIGL